MEKFKKRLMLPLCLLGAPLWVNAESVLDNLQFNATGTAGEAVADACTASLDKSSAELGKIDFTNITILNNPFTLRIQCSSPQRVKFRFVDNSATANPHIQPMDYVMNDSDNRVISRAVRFNNSVARADGQIVPLNHDFNDNGSTVASSNLSRLGSSYFGDKSAKSNYEVNVGRIVFAELNSVNVPAAETEVAVGGTFVITYGF